MAVRQAYLVLARRLRQLDRPIMGLWPFPEASELESVPRCLGRALASLGVRAALVEPRSRWRSGPAQAQPLIAADSEALDLLTPVRAESVDDVAVLDETLAFARGRYAFILLDLSGLDLTEAREVAAIPEVGIVLFVVRGRCGEFALAKVRRELPARRLLGGVLMDAESPAGLTVA